MPSSTSRRHAHQIETLRMQFAQTDGFPFADVLSAHRVQTALREEQATWRQQVYTPLLTLWAFLSQVLSPDGSCRATVARVLVWLVGHGYKPCSPKTDPYCKARQRLPESLLRRLMRETGQTLHEEKEEKRGRDSKKKGVGTRNSTGHIVNQKTEMECSR